MKLKKTICCLLIITLMITLFISSASASSDYFLTGSIDTSSFTKGEYVIVSGIAEGASHITGYLISSVPGYNDYFEMDINNDEYIFSIDTSDLASGEYYLIIQHPYYDGKDEIRMNNGVLYYFDVSRATYSQLVGYEGATVITNLIDHQSNNDIYVLLTFSVLDPVTTPKQVNEYSDNTKSNVNDITAGIYAIAIIFVLGIIILFIFLAVRYKNSNNGGSNNSVKPEYPEYNNSKVDEPIIPKNTAKEEVKPQNNENDKSDNKISSEDVNLNSDTYDLDSFSDIEIDNSPKSKMHYHINPDKINQDTSKDDNTKSDSCKNDCENICNSCGKKIGADAKFCKYCGAKIK